MTRTEHLFTPALELDAFLQRDTTTLLERFAESLRSLRDGAGSVDGLGFWSRALARAFLVQADAMLGVLGDLVLRAHQLGLLPLEAEDAQGLVAAEAADAGLGPRLRFLERLDLTLSAVARLWKLDEPLRKGDWRYPYFKALVGCRNQVTHPATVEDWLATGRIVGSVQLAVTWYTEEIMRILSGGHAKPTRNRQWEKEITGACRPHILGTPHPLLRRESIDTFYASVRQDPGACFRYTVSMGNHLNEDTQRWYRLVKDHLRGPQAPLFIRCYVRSFLTQVEGVCHARCRVVRWGHEDGRLPVQQRDAELLASPRLSFSAKTDIAFRLFPVLLGFASRADDSDPSRAAFDEVLARRHAFTHPRRASDLEAPLDLVLKTLNANQWFLRRLPLESGG